MKQRQKTIEKKILEETLYLCRSCGEWFHDEQMCDSTHCRKCNEIPNSHRVKFMPISNPQSEIFQFSVLRGGLNT